MPLPITLFADFTNFTLYPFSGYILYTITINQALSGQVKLAFNPVSLAVSFSVITAINGVHFDLSFENFAVEILVKLINPDLDPNIYSSGDLYRIQVAPSTYHIDQPSNFTIAVTFKLYRPKGLQLGGNLNIPTSPTGPIEVKVPIIDIYGQTTINGEYLSDMSFVIQDKHKYKCHTNIVDHDACGCVQHYLPTYKLKTTTFQENNIPLEKVVKGKGKSLQDKVLKIFNRTNNPDFIAFYERFIRYAMLKYILIRLIYGEFDLNKLCKNFNKQFFKDLKHSRFCAFVEFFEDPVNNIIGYDDYFIKCDQDC